MNILVTHGNVVITDDKKKKPCAMCKVHGCCKTCKVTCKHRHIVVIHLPLFNYYTDTMH